MAAVKIRPPRDARCRTYRDHLRDRVDKRQFLASMAVELEEWLKSNPEAPDLEEAPEGWHKFFDSFTICGEDECPEFGEGNPIYIQEPRREKAKGPKIFGREEVHRHANGRTPLPGHPADVGPRLQRFEYRSRVSRQQLGSAR